MTLKEVKNQLTGLDKVRFILPNGKTVPAHFHVTEVGKVTKNFIDCGGTLRNEEVCNFQLWTSVDIHHRLKPQKLNDIIELAQNKLEIADDLPIEVEYQAETIGKYGLEFDGVNFLLTSMQTDCLALENCGLPEPIIKVKKKLENLTANSCSPNSGCC